MLDDDHIELLFKVYNKLSLFAKYTRTTRFFKSVINIEETTMSIHPVSDIRMTNDPKTTILKYYRHLDTNSIHISFYELCKTLDITNEMITRFTLETI